MDRKDTGLPTACLYAVGVGIRAKANGTNCPACGERLPIKGLSFFMISIVVDKHCKASPECNLRVELKPHDKSVEIKQVSDGDGAGRTKAKDNA